MDQAVARALGILEAVASSPGPLRLTRIAEAVGLSKSTAHRQLQTLVDLGYVVREPDTNRYGASLKLWELGSAVVGEHPVKRAATPFLHELHRQCGHTVSLLLPVGDEVLYLDKIISPRSAHFRTRPGSRAPAPFTSGGRAMLAYDPDARERVERVAEQVKARRVLDIDAFMADLPRVRTRGYAINLLNPEVVSIGCALLARDGKAAAALSVSSSSETMDEAEQGRVADALLATCSRLAELVGRL